MCSYKSHACMRIGRISWTKWTLMNKTKLRSNESTLVRFCEWAFRELFLDSHSAFLILFVFFSTSFLGTMIWWSHPQQRIRKSIPTRKTSHSLLPHGCGFFMIILSPTSKSIFILLRQACKSLLYCLWKCLSYLSFYNQICHAIPHCRCHID